MNVITRIRRSYVVSSVTGALSIMLEDRATMFYFSFLIFILVLGAVGPMLAPYDASETLYSEEGDVLRNEAPSMEHPLGTNNLGQDLFSRMLVGAQPTAITGILGGTIIISIGLTVGITAGYMGGRIDDVLMRMTDIAYGVPLIPTAIVIVALMGIGFFESILVIGLILWRGSARVIRSQVLQIKERPFILDCKVSGASTPRILLKHILPNVATMAVLFFALGVGYSIIIQAGLAFIGVTDPFVPSWGVIIRNAYNAGRMGNWWWSIPPGIGISMTVLCTFMFGRSYERLSGQAEDDEAFTAMG